MRKLTGRAWVVSMLALSACVQAPLASDTSAGAALNPTPTQQPGSGEVVTIKPEPLGGNPRDLAAPVTPAPTPQPVVEAPKPPAWIGRLEAAAKTNAYRLDYDGKTFSGPAWDKLVAEGKAAQFFLLGEEHGIAENPKLAAQLFGELAKDGYSKLVIEVSPLMATALDTSARGGIAGLQTHLHTRGWEAAFFGMKEEAELLAAARAAVKGDAPVFWGVDYEVGGDRLLISKLEAKKKPAAAEAALAKLRAASTAAWVKYEAEKGPQFMFSFSGDPQLVRDVRAAWPGHDAEAAEILTALEETLEINKLWVEGKGYDSNVRRSGDMRVNFLKHWQAERAAGRKPKVFAKMGASHLMRGRNSTETYDIGTLANEIAFIEGGHAVSVMILPGKGMPAAVFNPVTFTYAPNVPKDDYNKGLAPIIDQADPKAFTLFDLKAMRPVMGNWRAGADPELMRIVHGFDYLLVMSGSTASSNLPAP